jgi:zinc finger RNA-binding protein
VGLLAKQLLLRGDSNVELVVLCGEKPTITLLRRIANHLPKQFKTVCPDEVKYEISVEYQDACLIVSQKRGGEDNLLSVMVHVTSQLMRDSEENGAKNDAPDVLDQYRCINALAELRHVKWFHSRALSRHSCTVVIRILRDLCDRNPTWAPLSVWMLELLVEKVLNSAGCLLSPGDALRRVFEALAGGILLPDSPGFLDPCEKEPLDAGAELTSQEREDITSSAQFALRMIAFRQIYKVLGIEPLPPPKPWRVGKKRRRDSNTFDGEEAEEKKDKKEA